MTFCGGCSCCDRLFSPLGSSVACEVFQIVASPVIESMHGLHRVHLEPDEIRYSC